MTDSQKTLPVRHIKGKCWVLPAKEYDTHVRLADQRYEGIYTWWALTFMIVSIRGVLYIHVKSVTTQGNNRSQGGPHLTPPYVTFRVFTALS